jgi:hypothetical protein
VVLLAAIPPHLFKLTALLFRLTAVLAVAFDLVPEPFLGPLDPPGTILVVIARTRGCNQ